MPRAYRYFIPGHIWHITHRCHKQEFLLKFARDRRRWIYWLFEAKKRYGLCVLNYRVTSNHIHLLIYDKGQGEISKSMQLIASRTAQEFNRRKKRKGAYWEDRYHATAIDSGEYLIRCLIYIDLNMVRAGVVTHPADWEQCGYREIQATPQKYKIINTEKLMQLTEINGSLELLKCHKDWIEEALKRKSQEHQDKWTQSLAVGSQQFTSQFLKDLSVKGMQRKLHLADDQYEVREEAPTYNFNL